MGVPGATVRNGPGLVVMIEPAATVSEASSLLSPSIRPAEVIAFSAWASG
jgi:hypothetical protein